MSISIKFRRDVREQYPPLLGEQYWFIFRIPSGMFWSERLSHFCMHYLGVMFFVLKKRKVFRIAWHGKKIDQNIFLKKIDKSIGVCKKSFNGIGVTNYKSIMRGGGGRTMIMKWGMPNNYGWWCIKTIYYIFFFCQTWQNLLIFSCWNSAFH